MDPNKEVIDIVNTIMAHFEINVMWTLVRASIAIMIVMMFYNMYKTIVAYVSFRANNDLGKNVKLIVNGREGFITNYTIRFIYIRMQDTHNEMIIPMRTWEDHDWIIVKNGNR